MYKGLFWLIQNKVGERQLYTVKREALDSDTLNHKREWEKAPKDITQGKPFDWFPRGRVEIRERKVIVFLNPYLNTPPTLDLIFKEFGLTDCQLPVDVKNDNSYHYKFLSDNM